MVLVAKVSMVPNLTTKTSSLIEAVEKNSMDRPLVDCVIKDAGVIDRPPFKTTLEGVVA